MNLKELKGKLDELGIDPSFYSLNGDLTCTGLILYNSYREWIVFEMDDRGNRHDEKIFYSENDACLYIYQYYQDFRKIFMYKK